jgi:hypothetical protein
MDLIYSTLSWSLEFGRKHSKKLIKVKPVLFFPKEFSLQKGNSLTYETGRPGELSAE